MFLFLLLQQLIISEIMYNPSGSEYHNEFIEVYNSGNQQIDLSDFQISDGTGTDNLVYFSGILLLNPGEYALILDGSYPENSEHYNSIIPSNTTVYVVNDNALGSGGLSNSRSEKISLILNSIIIDSITYQLSAENGFSYEKNIETGQWSFSSSENGTPGFKPQLVQTNYSYSYDYSSNILTYNLSDASIQVVILKSELMLVNYSDNKHSTYNTMKIEKTIEMINESGKFIISLNSYLQMGYTQLYITTNNKTDSLHIFVTDNYFPIHITKINLEKPQWLQLTNYSNYDYLLDTIKFKASGSWKNIPINKILKQNESIRLSKHDTSEEYFNEHIPFLYSNNVNLSIQVFHKTDSIFYSVNEIPFYESGVILSIEETNYFNYQNKWSVDR